MSKHIPWGPFHRAFVLHPEAELDGNFRENFQNALHLCDLKINLKPQRTISIIVIDSLHNTYSFSQHI